MSLWVSLTLGVPDTPFWSIHEVPWVGANCACTPPSLLVGYCMHEVPARCTSVPHWHSEPPPSFPHNLTLWQVQRQVMASHHLPPLPVPGVTMIPQILWQCPRWWLLPQPEYAASCVLLAAVSSPLVTSCIQVSPSAGLGLPHPGNGGSH